MSRGVEQACRAPLNKTLCSVLRISLDILTAVCHELTAGYHEFNLRMGALLGETKAMEVAGWNITRLATLRNGPHELLEVEGAGKGRGFRCADECA